MKLIRNVIATVLALIMAFSVTACHGKDELAVTVNGFKYTSAYYMCALINAYSEGQQQVINALGDKATAETDFFEQNIGGKKFEEWVKNRAIEILKEVGTYQKLCKDAKIELSAEMKSSAENMAMYYWNYLGYGALFEPNGVSYNTYLKFTTDAYYSELYFEHLYGKYDKEGIKNIPSADIESKLTKDFLVADLLEVTFQSQTDKEKEEIKAKFEGYLKALTDKTKTFDEIYDEYNKVEDDHDHDHDHDHDDKTEGDKAENDKTEDKTEDNKTENDKAENNKTEDKTEDDKAETEEDEELKAPYKYAQVLGAEGTGYDNDNFEEISKLKIDEAKLITKPNNGGYILVVKRDIKNGEYYRKNLDSIIRHLLKDDEFQKNMTEEFKKAKVEISDFAVDRFDVEDIKEPEASY